MLTCLNVAFGGAWRYSCWCLGKISAIKDAFRNSVDPGCSLGESQSVHLDPRLLAVWAPLTLLLFCCFHLQPEHVPLLSALLARCCKAFCLIQIRHFLVREIFSCAVSQGIHFKTICNLPNCYYFSLSL